jgi:hypothetical protein
MPADMAASQPAASGGTTSQSAGSGGTITESAVSALGAHFPGSVTADQFACWDDQWELAHLGGKLSGWLENDIQMVQKHGSSAQDIGQLYRDCKARVPIPAGWTSQGPKQPG